MGFQRQHARGYTCWVIYIITYCYLGTAQPLALIDTLSATLKLSIDATFPFALSAHCADQNYFQV